ncbi:hypothetical protein CAC42_7801 [Sphaceloma murrayae]|uniref:Uncharacterized protein n=1 Tax=Sphaceloma murrayae TaxID=2082308 RepID=A0A2K1QXQ5_9PEZI|nr:hypothetical protein CAC42_7801 [Sphaceloma murrayae]
MPSIVQTRRVGSLPSPTLTNPEMVLPDEAVAYITRSPPQVGRPPSPSYLLDHTGDKNVSVKSLSPKLSLGTMSRRRGLQRATTEEDNYGHLASTSTRLGDDKRDQEETDSKWQQPEMQRKASFVSTSTVSLDWDAIPDYKYDGEDSDIVTEDDGGSGTATPIRSARSESPAAQRREQSRSRSRSRSRRRAENSSAELSRRAELILANAKKRLNLMDQNLKGARALTAENLQRATSVHAHRSPYSNRYFGGNDTSEASESPTGPRLGHVRGRSDNTIIHPPVRSPPPIAAEVVQEEDEEPAGWAAAPLRISKSQELPQIRSLRSLRSTSRLQKSSLREAASASPSTPTSGRSGSDNGSSPATTELKNQVQELNRRVSLLRDRTREDSLRRQSFQNLRQPNPLTDAERYQNSVADRGAGSNVPKAPLTSRWSVDSSVKRQSTFIPGNSPSSVYSQASQNNDSHQAKRKSKRKSTDWRPVVPGKSQPISRFSLESEVSSDDETADIPDEAIDLGVTSSQTPPAHEDRHDAFDYHNFFLHSTLGRASHMSDSTSEASDDTARGPPTADLPDATETPEKLREIEREIERTVHKRFSSIDSLSSANSFATATEGLRSRQQSPVKRPVGSDGADSGVGLDSKTKGTQAIPPFTQGRDHHRRQLSSHISAQVQAIAAPPSSIAIAALAAPGKRSLGLRDRALTFMLLECIRHACEKLQDQDLDAGEGRILRRRIEEARRVMDGTAPVVS